MLVSVVGSPAPGVTIDFGNTFTSTDTGGGSDDEEESSGAVGSALVTDTFSSNDNGSETGTGHSQVTQNFSTDDGHGNTLSLDDSDYTSLSETGSLGDQDAGQETFTEANNLETGDTESDTDTLTGEFDPSLYATTMSNDRTVAVVPATDLTTTIDYQAGGTDTIAEQDTFSGTDVHSAWDTITDLQPTSEDVTSSTSDVDSAINSLTGHEQTSEWARSDVEITGVLSTGENVQLENLFVLSDNSNDHFSNADILTADGTNSDVIAFSGQFNVPTLYELQDGTVSTTDPTTGVTTSDSTVDCVDSKSSDSVNDADTAVTSASGAVADTPSSSETGVMQQVWSLTDIVSQTNGSGNPIGSVTTTSDNGSDTEVEQDGVINDPGATDAHVASVLAASSSPPVLPSAPNPGDLFTQLAAAQAGGSGQAGDPPPNAPAPAVKQELEDLELAVQGEKEQAADTPWTVSFTGISDVVTDQNGILQIELVSADAKAAISAALVAGVQQQLANESAGQQLFTDLGNGMAEVDSLILPGGGGRSDGRFENPDNALGWDIYFWNVGRVASGEGQAVVGTVVGLWELVSNPRARQNLQTALWNIRTTAPAVANAAVKPFIDGDLEGQGYVAGNALIIGGTVAVPFAGGTKAGALAEVGEAAGAAEAVEAVAIAEVGGGAEVAEVVEAANAATAAARSNVGTSVLGKSPGYLQLGEKLGAKVFNIPTATWNMMTEAEQLAANQAFLDGLIANGDNIVLSSNALQATGAFKWEIDYLLSKGYQLSADGWRIFKP